MKLPHLFVFLSLLLLILACHPSPEAIEPSPFDLVSDTLAKSWDEGIPLGNGLLGALIWERQGKLRFSLDRADLWDLWPMENLKKPEWRYAWVYEQWQKNNYRAVQEKFDRPYDQSPAPSKIPAGALEFDLSLLGQISAVRLLLASGTAEIKWENGTVLQVFVDANGQTGWYRFTGLPGEWSPLLIPPAYNLEGEAGADNPVQGQDLRRLGYPKGRLQQDKNQITYDQEGWGGFSYQVHTTWKQTDSVLEGCWSISAQLPGTEGAPTAVQTVQNNFPKGFDLLHKKHREWWKQFWSASTLSIPDSLLLRQWYLEQYKFGAAARKGAPPISLQAVWTADNGRLPPWKGDFHHDLNTQLSYWPAYAANHLDLEEGFIDWLWTNRETFRRYTKDYFGVNGLNVPGVTTLTGEPMGGWIQYSFGPTVSAWLAQHFYWHWCYTMDPLFLQQKAYPWVREVAIYLDEVSRKNADGKRSLPISSSPEINNNERDAWFPQTTNFDLALIRWTYQKAAEMAKATGEIREAEKWEKILAEWPALDVDENSGLTIAPGYPYAASHRHFSHLMAIHPLGVIDLANGPADRDIIQKSLSNLFQQGTEQWVGYSFSWQANLYARARLGQEAAEALHIFAENFCLPNSFHVNGDQSGKGYSKFTYRPFTLEGNFAFAAGLQEMLLQSHTPLIRIFPAIPADWQEVSFDKLRAQGAFLISARRKDGHTVSVEIFSERDGALQMANPFSKPFSIKGNFRNHSSGDTIRLEIPRQERIILEVKNN